MERFMCVQMSEQTKISVPDIVLIWVTIFPFVKMVDHYKKLIDCRLEKKEQKIHTENTYTTTTTTDEQQQYQKINSNLAFDTLKRNKRREKTHTHRHGQIVNSKFACAFVICFSAFFCLG